MGDEGKETPDEHGYAQMATSAAMGFQGLRTLVNSFVRQADEYDREALEAFGATLRELFPNSLRKDSESDASGPNGETGPAETTSSSKKPSQESGIDQDLTAVLRDRASVKRLAMAAKDLSTKNPMQGRLMRQGALTTLMSQYEWVISQLLHAYYHKYPDSLNGDDRKLTLTDLRRLGSVRDAERLIVAREVDGVLRSSTNEQVRYFTSRLKVPCHGLDGLMADLEEVAQRRNLYVHNAGIANDYYLGSVHPDLAAKYSVKKGAKVPLPTKYLLSAIDVTRAAAAILLNSCWRKWDFSSECDSHLLREIYEGLCDRRHEFVKLIATHSSAVRFEEEASSRIMLVNHAIALRELGDNVAALALLDSVDWSATSLKFQVAIAAMREQRPQFEALLPRAINAREMTPEDLHEWPLFEPWRKEAWFKELMERFESQPPSQEGAASAATVEPSPHEAALGTQANSTDDAIDSGTNAA